MTMIRSFVIASAVLVASAAYAQEPQVEQPKTPSSQSELTPDERTAFDTVKAMESLASAKALDTKEGRAFQKARAAYEEKLKAFQAAIQATPEHKAAMQLRQKLDARVKARGAGAINWTTGAVSPSATKR